MDPSQFDTDSTTISQTFYTQAMGTNGFFSHEGKEKLPKKEAVQKCIDENMEYYRKMYSLRIKATK